MRASIPFGVLVAALASPYLAFADPIFDNGYEECGAVTTRACYTGPAGTLGVGACRAGTQHCENGAWSPCTSELTPAAESCNLSDDDCDVAVDESLGSTTCGLGACQTTVAACSAGVVATCTPGQPTIETCDGIDNDCDGAIDEDGCNCVHVSPTGLDTNPGTAANPMKTIGAAIAKAASSGPAEVCVAAGVVCTTANYDESVVMQNGIDVYGGYQATGTTWPRSATCITRIRAQDALGVQFPASVTSPTILDGFAITGNTAASNAAVTIIGSTGAVLSNDTITGGTGTTSIGVNVLDDAATPATPKLVGDGITGGTGTALAIGVRSLNSTPRLQANCSTLDGSGRCTSLCLSGGTTRFVRGRIAGNTGAESYGVRLENSPGAVIDSSAVCSNGTSSASSAGIRISGDATGVVVRTSNVSGSSGAVNAAGVWMDACGGASPWLVDNQALTSRGTDAGSRTDGVRTQGDCHPRIDENIRIQGNDEGGNGDSSGVRCGVDSAGVASRCTVSDNVQILGSTTGFVPTATGVRCEDGACAAIRGNQQIRGNVGQSVTGVALGASGTLVDANLIQAGCTSGAGTGLRAVDSFARIQNNRIEGANIGGTCAVTPSTSVAVALSLGARFNEVDLHSNDLVASVGMSGSCTSWGLQIGLAGAAPGGGRGLIRNNIVFAGTCNTSFAVDELAAGADPRVLQNNDLWGFAATALYRDEAANNLATIAAVNALGDVTASGNISADPDYDGSNNLTITSPCRDAGISDGAPALDFGGTTRPQGPAYDIGHDEFTN